MTANLLIVGDPEFDDPATVEKAVEHAYLLLRPEGGHVILLTMNQTGPELVAETYWASHGMQQQRTHTFANRYVTFGNILRNVVPDLVLIFGNTNLCVEAATRCAAAEIRHTQII